MRHITIHRLYFTKNDCYNADVHGPPHGIQVHSTGAANPYLHRYVGPDDGLLGPNKCNNTWNQPGFKKCANAFIGKLQNGTVAIYQTLPWETHCWLSDVWLDSKGNKDPKAKSANAQGFIGFEVCEDNRKNRDYFMDAVMDKSVNLCAFLCWKYNLDVNAVLDHSELHKLHMANDHGDITWWLKPFGYNMSMYRNEVRKAMAEGVRVTYIEGDKTWMDGPEESEKTQEETTVNKKMVVIGDGYLNLRAEPSKSAASIGKLNPGDVVTVTQEFPDGWAFVNSSAGQGYVMEAYLAPAPEESPEEPPAPDAPASDELMEWLGKAVDANAALTEALEHMQILLTGAVG